MSSSSFAAREQSSSVLHSDSRPSTFYSATSSSRCSTYSSSCLEYGLDIIERMLTEDWAEPPSRPLSPTSSLRASPSLPHLSQRRRDEDGIGVRSDYHPTIRRNGMSAAARRTPLCASEMDDLEKQEWRRGGVFNSDGMEIPQGERPKCRRKIHPHAKNEADYDSSGDEGPWAQQAASLLTPPESSWEDDSDCDVEEGAGPWVMPTDVVDCYMNGWGERESRMGRWRIDEEAAEDWSYVSPERVAHPRATPSRYSRSHGKTWEADSSTLPLGEVGGDSAWFDDEELPNIPSMRPLGGMKVVKIAKTASQGPLSQNADPRRQGPRTSLHLSKSVSNLAESNAQDHESNSNTFSPSLRFTHPPLLSKRFSTKPSPRAEPSELRKMRHDGSLRSVSSTTETSISTISSPSIQSHKLFPFRNDSAGELVPEARLPPAYSIQSSPSPPSSILSPPTSPSLGASRRYHYTKMRTLPDFGEELDIVGEDMIPPSIIRRREELLGKRISKQASFPSFGGPSTADQLSEGPCSDQSSVRSPSANHSTLDDVKSTKSEGDLRKKKQRASKIGQFMGKVLLSMGGGKETHEEPRSFNPIQPQTPRMRTISFM